MMLRLKANYFWPASKSFPILTYTTPRMVDRRLMTDGLFGIVYASMFDVDGLDISDGFPNPAIPGPNQLLANQMGIIMGTSHHEPMARNKPEWDRGQQGSWDWKENSDYLKEWWTYGAERAKGMETLFTMGMRGDGDEPLKGASIPLVESELTSLKALVSRYSDRSDITATQQGILKHVYETEDLSGVPQMWCMYKEVAEYYVNGVSQHTCLSSLTPGSAFFLPCSAIRLTTDAGFLLFYFSWMGHAASSPG